MRLTFYTLIVFLLLCVVGWTPAYAQFELEVAFPELTFASPVDIQHAGDGSDRLFVAELKTGRIIVFDNDENASESEIFLDLSQVVRTSNGEEGLLGLAFHPDYATNGHFFVHYSASNPRRSVIERYTASPPSSMSADPESGLLILQETQPYGNHNGGQLAFGPEDGYLYIALGDGGSAGDPDENGQDLSTLLGSILRIDINNATEANPYTVPDTNPFKDNTSGFREEIFAYGLRNPWRFSFDPETDRLWTGDVGQNAREEISIIESGKNYGWNTMEGTLCFDPGVNCPTDGLTLPVWDYGRGEGRSVTGGYVYRGSRVPELTGSYVYADFETGRIWALAYDGAMVTDNQLLTQVSFGVSAFGVSENRELFVCGFDGRIHQFVETNSTGISPETPEYHGFLETNYPNPVRSTTTIPYGLRDNAQVELVIYDMLGRQIETLVNRYQQAGEYQTSWKVSSGTAPGIYYYSLRIDGQTVQTRGFLVL